MRKMGGYQGKGKKEDGLLLKHAFCLRAQARVQQKHGLCLLCLSFMCLFCLSDLVKRHLSCMSWPKDISICLFQIRANCQDQSHLLVLANMTRNTYIFLFRLTSLQPGLSQRLSRAHLDLCTALPSIICQVSLFSFNISTNCSVKTQITLGMLVVL